MYTSYAGRNYKTCLDAERYIDSGDSPMNHVKILDDLLLLFWSFAWIAVTYQQAKKSGQASRFRTLEEINARPYLSWHYWYLERVRAYSKRFA